MNRIHTSDNGGFPVVLNDHRFYDAAVRQAFYGLLSAWGISQEESFRISGAVATFNPNIGSWGGYDISEGYISFEGEILKVDAHQVEDPEPPAPFGHTHHWVIDESNDPDGLKSFRDQVARNTYKIRRAKVLMAFPEALNPMPMAAPTLNEVITGKVFATFHSRQGEDQVPTLINGWVPGSNALVFYKDAFGNVHFRGDVNGENASSEHFMTLPNTGFRPGNDISLVCARFGATVLNGLNINSNGECRVRAMNNQPPVSSMPSVSPSYGNGGDIYRMIESLHWRGV